MADQADFLWVNLLPRLHVGDSRLDVIREIKADPHLTNVPCMLVTNYAEHQQSAVKAGAEYGFGKKELYAQETQQRLARFLKD